MEQLVNLLGRGQRLLVQIDEVFSEGDRLVEVNLMWLHLTRTLGLFPDCHCILVWRYCPLVMVLDER